MSDLPSQSRLCLTGYAAVVLWSAGCGSPVELPATPELVRATDTNPDPAIVEVQLAATAATASLVDGVETPVLAYRDGSIDGSVGVVPGPMIEAKVGDRLIVHFLNELADTSTTIHWHGLRLPIEMDGDPTVNGAVPPGGTFDYDFPLLDAGLFWYHPHVETDEQIELGLQGTLLVHDLQEPPVDADRTFVLDDVDLENGEIRIEASREDLMLGRRGNTMLVNGRTLGRMSSARNAVERWRFVNTANGRFYDLSIGRTMRVIGWDGGLVAAPYDVGHLVIAPGERYEVLVTIEDETSIRTLEVERAEGLVDEAADLVQIVLDGEVTPRELPSVAGDVSPLVSTGQRLQFRLKEELDSQAGAVFFINDERWPFNVPIDVQLGDVATWEIVNDNAHAHPFHLHGHFAQVLDVNGVVEPNLGWKDTIQIAPRSMVRALVRYEAVGKWMAHCQIPEHAERGMTADFNVIP